METKMDYKKQDKALYLPSTQPGIIDVPEMTFIMIDGAGDPNGVPYQAAVGALFALSYTIKMSRMGVVIPEGYFDYVVPPLEGLWWIKGANFDFNRREDWLWTSMIRQPEFVTPDVFNWAIEQCRSKKPEVDVSAARLASFAEGLCVQGLLHVGSFVTEPASVDIMRAYMAGQGLADETGSLRKHHEIYLTDPRKTQLDKMKTVLRHPVAAI